MGIVWDYIKKVCRCLLYIIREYSNAAKAWAFTRHESESDGIRIFGIRKHLVAIPSKSTIYWKYGWSKNMVFTIVFSRFLQRQDLRQSATKQACLPKEAHPIEQPFWMVPNHGVNPLWKTMVNTGGCKKNRGMGFAGRCSWRRGVLSLSLSLFLRFLQHNCNIYILVMFSWVMGYCGYHIEALVWFQSFSIAFNLWVPHAVNRAKVDAIKVKNNQRDTQILSNL